MRRAGRRTEAIDAYRRYLDGAPDALDREAIRAELERLQSSIELTSAGETRIDGRPVFLLRVSERTEGGVQYERIVAGTHGQSKMFWASCKALTRYFFERARPVCERAIESCGSPGCDGGFRTTGARAGPTNQAPSVVQFSTTSDGTRENSRTLSVTSTASRARACAAIQVSLAPIGKPWRSSRARTSP